VLAASCGRCRYCRVEATVSARMREEVGSRQPADGLQAGACPFADNSTHRVRTASPTSRSFTDRTPLDGHGSRGAPGSSVRPGDTVAIVGAGPWTLGHTRGASVLSGQHSCHRYLPSKTGVRQEVQGQMRPSGPTRDGKDQRACGRPRSGCDYRAVGVHSGSAREMVRPSGAGGEH